MLLTITMALLSSPCAAMQPPPAPKAWGFTSDMKDEGRPFVSSSGSFGRSSGASFSRSQIPFSFDISRIRASAKDSGSAGDYFAYSSGPVRGSSPAASLAADLSQNFHIEKRYVSTVFRCCV